MDISDTVGMKEFINNQICHLRKEMLTRIESNKELFTTKLESSMSAVAEAKKEMDRRMEEANNLRKQLDKQGEDVRLLLTKYIERAEYQVILNTITDRLDKIDRVLAKAEGKADQKSVTTATIIAVTGIVLGLVSLLVGTFLK